MSSTPHAYSVAVGSLAATSLLALTGMLPKPAPMHGLSPEQIEIIGHMSLVYLDDGQGGLTKTIRISDANLQIVNGLSDTETTNGVGNLIVGYNELGGADNRTGSHNIVCGKQNSYRSYGGAVFAYQNEVQSPYATVTGGRKNLAREIYSSISGGFVNKASGPYSSISGGNGNATIGQFSSISGGIQNQARQTFSSVSGGDGNIASGLSSSVSGGQDNIASGPRASVSGGRQNEASDFESSVSGGEGNLASEKWSAILGGQANLAGGQYSSIGGGCGLMTSSACEHQP